MDDKTSKELLGRLSHAAGAPGAEDEVRDIVRTTLAGVGTIRYDKLGSLLCEKRGEADSPRVVVDSHMDEVAFMVQSISDEGKLAFVPLGGWWGHVLLGQRVDIVTEKAKVPGVVGSKPPHFLTPEERKKVIELDKMYIDVGASKRSEVEELGIRLGDAIVPSAEFREMGVEGVLSGKALDNRVGVSLMCETMLALADREHPNTVIGAGCVQEEIGLRGAGTASELVRPDVGLVLECTPADDLPGHDVRQAILGNGPQLRLFDPTAISNRRLARFVQAVADECEVQIQTAVRRTGGTDAGSIHRSRSGVPTVVLGVPARYIHSHVSVMQWRDYGAARKLIAELVVRLDADRVEELTRFD